MGEGRIRELFYFNKPFKNVAENYKKKLPEDHPNKNRSELWEGQLTFVFYFSPVTALVLLLYSFILFFGSIFFAIFIDIDILDQNFDTFNMFAMLVASLLYVPLIVRFIRNFGNAKK